MATLDSLLALGASPEAQDIHSIVAGLMDQDRKRKLAEQLQSDQRMEHLIGLQREEMAREHADKLRYGGVQGIPIPAPEPMSDYDVAAIMEGPNRFAQQGLGGTRVQAGGRSIGPDLGIMGASPTGDLPSNAPPPDMKAFLQAKGLTPGAAGTPGIGIDGQHFALPENMRSSETAMDVIARVQQEHPYQGFPRQTNPHVVNRAQAKQLGRDGIPAGAAHMFARTDDGGQMGRFAQAAISPQGAKAMGDADAQMAQNALATRTQNFKEGALVPTMAANILASMTNPTAQTVAAIFKMLAPYGQGAGQGGIPQSAMAGIPGMGGASARPQPFADELDNTKSDAAMQAEWEAHGGGFGDRSIQGFREKMFQRGFAPAVVNRWIQEHVPAEAHETQGFYGMGHNIGRSIGDWYYGD